MEQRLAESFETALGLAQGIAVEGNGYRFTAGDVDVRVEPLTDEQRAAFCREQGVEDPFGALRKGESYVFFKVRFENRRKEGDLVFSPQAAMFGNGLAFDEIKVYQYFYRDKDADAILASAGKVLFLKNLVLPPGYHLERLLMFQYDDPYPVKKISLIIGSLMAGQDGLDLEFRFRATYRKEKTS